ncbi:MAG: 2-C-methyl-D-erythritol 4-phosphate cytidylyltransferase / 2-C-methyl-D-erythritol [Pelagibacterales bacterium]|nr:2-C-methyl-D-erythritol 4-phosphate cytidylyltransferase / 2-C-methyl-D-erythritol [Pelagibacterales bacterium]
MGLFLIILAAGDNKRLNSDTPKPYQEVNNTTLLEHSLNAFNKFPEIKKKIVVYNKKHSKFIKILQLKKIYKIIGGKTRQESTYKALIKCQKMNCKKVLIHDSARPAPSKELINEVINGLKKNDAVVPVIKINDATKRIKNNLIFKNIERETLRCSQTPQGFVFKKIYTKHKKYKSKFFDDDSALFVNDKEKILTVRGDKKNLKITTMDDLYIFKSLKKGKTSYGIGFDIHRLIKKKKLYLGGVKIPFPFGLDGHSDGDPVLHALIDSLLGACGLGDIGKMFSDKNKKFKNIKSTILLKEVIDIIRSKNFIINNIDINIIAQKPRIRNYIRKIESVISKICRINRSQINIKGKTSEKLGLIGNGQAIASEVITSVINYD